MGGARWQRRGRLVQGRRRRAENPEWPEEERLHPLVQKKYRNFVVEFEFRMGEGRVDSGMHVRTKDQIQIGISGSLNRDMTCSPYIPGKGYPVEAKNIKKLLRPKDWNTMRIQAIGKEYTVWLQGEKVMTYKSDSAIDEGPIGIQLHGGRNMAIDYRKLKLAELP